MKWLATTFLCLLTVLALAETPKIPQAQEPSTQVIVLPFVMQCSPVHPDQMLEQNYQEIGFLEGDSSVFLPSGQLVNGKIRMFVKPEQPRTFTVMFEITPEVHCMLTSGSNLRPMVAGDKI